MDDATYCMTTPHKSSCASADPSDNDAAAGHDGAISDLYGQGERVKAVLTHYEGTLKCVTTWVYNPDFDGGLLLDNVPLKSGCV